MFLDAIVRLYDYQREVNDHVLNVAAQLSDDEFTSVLIEGQPSVRDTLLHMLGVIQINVAWWNRRLTGEEAFELEFPSSEFQNIGSLKALSDHANSELSDFIGSLDADDDLGRIYQRTTPSGEHRKRVLWEMMLHVINHGTQHRSEVAMMLTKLGQSPGDMEIL